MNRDSMSLSETNSNEHDDVQPTAGEANGLFAQSMEGQTQTQTSNPAAVTASIAPSPGSPISSEPAYDEFHNASGEMRPHWDKLIASFDGLGAKEVAQRWQKAQRIIIENGVTYNAYAGEDAVERAWALDPLPFVMDSAEWQAIEAGLVQRATLLNRIIADLYGPQQLLKDGLIPAELIFGNQQFLRACSATHDNSSEHPGLVLYAVDLARSPTGQWWVLNDHTQAPSGMGYALENRLIITRTFPTMFRECGIQRLARFFQKLDQTLVRMSPRKIDNPRIVLLTPGEGHETYFEHAYLARYLGYTLVEGTDLTVRDNIVYLKKLGGLERVDVILRRLNDSDCDPLELQPDSANGVPGLVQAAAQGKVVIANALGTGVLEAAAIRPFFRTLCQSLLGEDLLLPSAATWWCGQPAERAEVLSKLRELVIKPAFAPTGTNPIFGAKLSDDELDELRQQIEANPTAYVAQESVTLSTTPVWSAPNRVSRHLVLRAYVAATDDGYTVMPGGLGRVSPTSESSVVAMRHGGGSKDVWVLADGPVSSFSMLPDRESAYEVSREGPELPSRVADNMLWLGRYVERAEVLTSLMRCVIRRMTEETLPGGNPELGPLVRTIEGITEVPVPDGPIEDPLAEYSRTSRYLRSLITDKALIGSLRQNVDAVRRTGAKVRDRISMDTWRVIDQMSRSMERPAPHEDLSACLVDLDDLMMPILAFSGMSSESMTRGYGWCFLNIGRRLERATTTLQLIKHMLGEPQQSIRASLTAALEVANSLMTYRARYRATVTPPPTLDMLLLDETNPRSVIYQIHEISDCVQTLPRPELPGLFTTSSQDEIHVILQQLYAADVKQLVVADEANRCEALLALIDSIDAWIVKFGDRLSQQYLTHTLATQSLNAVSPDTSRLRGTTL